MKTYKINVFKHETKGGNIVKQSQKKIKKQMTKNKKQNREQKKEKKNHT